MYVDEYWSHSFILNLVRPQGVVYDIGVNDGGFARLVAARCRRVIGYEPDPVWRDRLNLPANVTFIPKAIAATTGVLDFHVNQVRCSSLHYSEIGTAGTVPVEAVTLEDALALEPEGLIDLIKMDIEGEEIEVLATATDEQLQRVVQLTVEFHDFIDSASVPAIQGVIHRLQSLGFFAIRFSWRSYGDLLFINTRLVQLGLIQRWWLVLRYKYLRGVSRVLKRALGIKK